MTIFITLKAILSYTTHKNKGDSQKDLHVSRKEVGSAEVSLTVYYKPSFNYNNHGLRTRNEGINKGYLKNWADVADKICFGRT